MRERGAYLFILPTGLVAAAVTIFPIFYVLWLSLQERLLVLGSARFIGLENFTRLAGDARFWNALGNTAYFTGVSVALELALGLGIALALQRAFRGRGWMRAVVLIPWAVPTVVAAKMWEWMYNADFGVLNYLLGAQINWLGSPAWALHAAILLDVWKTTPFVALLLMAGLQTIPQDLYKAARVDRASAWVVFRRITLPLLAPLMLVVLIFRTIDAVRVFDVIYVLTGGGPGNATETLSIYAYKLLFQTLQFGYGSAVAVTVFVLVGLITAFYLRLMQEVAR